VVLITATLAALKYAQLAEAHTAVEWSMRGRQMPHILGAAARSAGVST
jgi:hypothetical protein